jgi:hypothetical protein
MITVMGDTAWDRDTGRVIELPGGAAGLESGLADGRYGCRACGQSLILRGARAQAKVTPHFSHRGTGDRCPAAERQRRIGVDDQVVVELRDRLVRAWPGVSVSLELPEEAPAPGHAPVTGLPPAIVVRGAEEGAVTAVIERPRRLPGPEEVNQRIRAVRARYGSGAAHMWFLAKDPVQFARLRRLSVKPRGRDQVFHATVAPTEQQLAIIAAGGGVYWLDGQQVLVPYGVHDFTHQPRQGEDWNFPDRRRYWRYDWRISHPVPAPDATRWGLVPLALHQLTHTRATFDLAEARDIMQRLHDVERARWRARRTAARDLHAARHSPPTPASPSGADVSPAESRPGRNPPTPAQPSAQSSPRPPEPPTAPPPPPRVPAPPPHPPAPPRPTPRGLRGLLHRLLRGR